MGRSRVPAQHRRQRDPPHRLRALAAQHRGGARQCAAGTAIVAALRSRGRRSVAAGARARRVGARAPAQARFNCAATRTDRSPAAHVRCARRMSGLIASVRSITGQPREVEPVKFRMLLFEQHRWRARVRSRLRPSPSPEAIGPADSPTPDREPARTSRASFLQRIPAARDAGRGHHVRVLHRRAQEQRRADQLLFHGMRADSCPTESARLGGSANAAVRVNPRPRVRLVSARRPLRSGARFTGRARRETPPHGTLVGTGTGRFPTGSPQIVNDVLRRLGQLVAEPRGAYISRATRQRGIGSGLTPIRAVREDRC